MHKSPVYIVYMILSENWLFLMFFSVCVLHFMFIAFVFVCVNTVFIITRLGKMRWLSWR